MVIVQRGVKIGDIYARAEEQEANLGRAKGWAKGRAKGWAKGRDKKLRSVRTAGPKATRAKSISAQPLG